MYWAAIVLVHCCLSGQGSYLDQVEREDPPCLTRLPRPTLPVDTQDLKAARADATAVITEISPGDQVENTGVLEPTIGPRAVATRRVSQGRPEPGRVSIAAVTF